jgi:hypothetical protein
MALLGLAEHLATGAPIDRQAAEAWPMSDSGKQFVTRASNDWSRASIAAGTDQAAATGAAKRTTAFYTGSEPPTD